VVVVVVVVFLFAAVAIADASVPVLLLGRFLEYPPLQVSVVPFLWGPDVIVVVLDDGFRFIEPNALGFGNRGRGIIVR